MDVDHVVIVVGDLAIQPAKEHLIAHSPCIGGSVGAKRRPNALSLHLEAKRPWICPNEAMRARARLVCRCLFPRFHTELWLFVIANILHTRQTQTGIAFT
jgi:hypothetical protein